MPTAANKINPASRLTAANRITSASSVTNSSTEEAVVDPNLGDPVADGSGNFTLTDSRWVAIQAAIASGTTPLIDWTLTGTASDSGSFTANSSNLENLDGSDYGNSELVGYLGAGTYQLTASQNGGGSDLLDQRVAIGKTNSGYIPQQLGNGAHSEPRALFTDGSIIQSHVSVSAKRIFCSVDGVYVGEIFADINSDGGAVDFPDTYHRAVTFARVADGLVAVHTSHNKSLSLRFAPWASTLAKTAELLCEAPSFVFSTVIGGQLTYGRLAVSTDGNTIYAATRGHDKHSELLTITDFQTGFSVASDVLVDDAHGWGYPRLCKVEQDGDGNDKVHVGFNLRNGSFSNWGAIIYAVYDPSGDDWYNINGVSVGGASKGTTTTPRFTNTEAANDVSSAGILLEDGVSGGVRYCISMGARLSQWTAAGTKEAEVVYDFADIPASTDGYAASGIDFRVAVARGSSVGRTTGISGTPPSIVNALNLSATYRLAGHIYYSGDTAKIVVSEGGTSGIDATNDYANWGTDGNASNQATYKTFSIDLSGSIPTLDSAMASDGDSTLIVPEDERFIEVGNIENANGGLVCHTGSGHVNDWDMQGGGQIVNSPTISPETVAPFGGHATLDTGLVSFWRMDCSLFWPDVKGTNHFTNNGTISRTTGENGGAASIPLNANLVASEKPYSGSVGAFSVFARVKSSVTGGDDFAILSQYNSGSADRGWVIALSDTDGQLRVILTDDGSTIKKDYTVAGSLADGTWHTVGFSFNAGTLKLYVDGSEATTTKSTDLAMTTIREPSAALLAGAINGGTSWNKGGQIDDAGIWTKVVSAAEFSALDGGLTY